MSGLDLNIPDKNNFSNFSAEGLGWICPVAHKGNFLFISQYKWVAKIAIKNLSIYPTWKSWPVGIEIESEKMKVIKGNGSIGRR